MFSIRKPTKILTIYLPHALSVSHYGDLWIRWWNGTSTFKTMLPSVSLFAILNKIPRRRLSISTWWLSPFGLYGKKRIVEFSMTKRNLLLKFGKICFKFKHFSITFVSSLGFFLALFVFPDFVYVFISLIKWEWSWC